MSLSTTLLPGPSQDSGKRALSPLGLFVDRLLQTFEDRRPGLKDAQLRSGEASCESFFVDVYEKERARLQDLVSGMEHLEPRAREALFSEVDKLIRTVVIPAYLRVTVKFTPTERNDFFLIREGLHALERVGWGVVGMAVGAFVVWAPFIPLWSKEWVLPFAIGGLFLPELRRWLSFRRYERELNKLVAHADREAGRIDVAYLMGGVQAPPALSAVEATPAGEEAVQSGPDKTGVR